MNVKLGLVILLGLTAVSFSQSTTTSDKRTPLDTFKAAGYYVDLYGVELENAKSAFHPESMTVEELTEMGNFLDNKTTTIRQHLDTIHWEKLRTRFESGLWNRGSDAAYSLGSLMANYRTLNKQVQAWLKRKQFKEPVHGEIPHFLHSSYQTDTTTTTVKPTLRIQVPLSSMLRMPQYAHNETVILWGQLAADFDKNRNDKVKVEEIAVRALNETAKVMDRAEELRARLAGMNQTWVEYKQTKMDEQFLSAMARRIYTRHEDAVMRGHKLKEGWRQVMPSTTTVSLVSTTVSTTSTTPKPQQFRSVQISESKTDETIRRGIANGGEIFQTYHLGG